ncbi:MAG TPA: OmpH family outer membrane protein [Polyangia bacterium]|nr:OmpH family outer membrane protein [Polyangia bacterium]
MSMSRLSQVALFLAVSLVGTKVFAEELKLGYVDLQRALSETDDGRKAKANLKKIFDQKQKELDEQQEDIKKAIDDLDKKRTLLPADKVHDKEVEIQGRMQKVQQAYLRHQQDLQAKEQEATSKIFERMNKILGKIAIAENFTMILDKTQGGIVFAKPHLDLTNDLIRRYNNGEGADAGGTAAKTPAPAPKK